MKNTPNPITTNQSQLKGIDKMDTKSSAFDMTAALNVAPAWDPASFITEYCHTLEQAQASQKPLKYIMGEDGVVYEMRSTDVGDFIIKANKVNGAAKIKEGFTLNVPKLPFRLLLQAVSFFRDVCSDFNNDEAMLQYWFDKETKEFFADCVQQTTNKVHVTYLRNKELEEDPNKVLVMDIHSHNNMEAFFSGTDDASEQETRTYGVIGKLDREIPTYKFRISVEGNFKEIAINQIFEMPKVKIYSEDFETEGEMEPANLFFPNVEYPKEWLAMIEEGKRSRSKFQGKGNHPHGRLPRNSSKDYGLDRPASRNAYLPNADDIYAVADQLSIFSDESALRPQKDYRGFERDGFDPEEEEDLGEVFGSEEIEYHTEQYAELMEQVQDPEIRVGMLAPLLSELSMHEVKMLVDRMVELGFDHEIIDQMRENGYVIRK